MGRRDKHNIRGRESRDDEKAGEGVWYECLLTGSVGVGADAKDAPDADPGAKEEDDGAPEVDSSWTGLASTV